jgi:hypothetical protein
VEALIGLTILHFRWGGVNASRILVDALKAALAAVTMGAAIYGFANLVQPSRFVLLLGGGAIGLIVYVLTALLLGLDEVRTLPISLLRGLIKRRK